MTITARMRYLIITLAILTASVIELVRGYRPLIVIVGAMTFLFTGNLIVWLSGWKERKLRQQRKRDYFAGRDV